ncbi:MAG: DNA double-strand break repair nuclease NurA [Candidatus Caldarchaeum sp.]
MLESLFSKAVSLGVRSRQVLDGDDAKRYLKEAEAAWNVYEPRAVESSVAAVDSGWNTLLYHGFFLYGLKAVAVDRGGNDVVPSVAEVELVARTEGLLPQLYVEAVAESQEHRLAAESSANLDSTLVDGSLLARTVKASRLKGLKMFNEYLANLRPLLDRRIFFVSKYSQDNSMFKGLLGDVYYINKSTSETGYTQPAARELETVGSHVWVFYVRLAKNTPALHFESTQPVSASDIEGLMDALSTTSVKGYPAELLMAHQGAGFSYELMVMLAEVAGLAGFEQAREVLSPE